MSRVIGGIVWGGAAMVETEQSALLDNVNSNSQQGSVEQQKHEKVRT